MTSPEHDLIDVDSFDDDWDDGQLDGLRRVGLPVLDGVLVNERVTRRNQRSTSARLGV